MAMSISSCFSGRNAASFAGMSADPNAMAALLAGLAVFTIVFASGLDPAGGPGLMFISLPLSLIPLYRDKNMFHIIEFSVSNIMLPLTAFLIAVFAGWVMSAKLLREEIGIRDDTAFLLWRLLTRYVAPVGVGCVLVFGLIS